MSEIMSIPLNSIYIGYPEHVFSSQEIVSDLYLLKMARNINNLPPISVIDLEDLGICLGEKYSLSDGYHRYSVHKFLGKKEIKAEILNKEVEPK